MFILELISPAARQGVERCTTKEIVIHARQCVEKCTLEEVVPKNVSW